LCRGGLAATSAKHGLSLGRVVEIPREREDFQTSGATN
jgi:hypothetical protein